LYHEEEWISKTLISQYIQSFFLSVNYTFQWSKFFLF